MPRNPTVRNRKSPKQIEADIREKVTDAYRDETGDKEYGYTHWQLEFNRYEKTFKDWERKADRILEQYTGSDETITNPTSKFNVFFSVVSTLQPAIHARTPRPDVSRRFRDVDPAARVASTILERCLDFEIDHCSDYRSSLSHVVFDYLTVGRGTCWVRYEPHIKAKELDLPTDGTQISEDIDAPYEEVIAEESAVDYVHWREFGYTASARTWEEVQAVWRQVFLGREQLIARFGKEIGEKIPLDAVPDSRKQIINKQESISQQPKQGLIYEVWCKTSKTVYWVSKSLGRIIDKKPDPLGLAGFYPTPRPLWFGLINDSLVPNPMYRQIQDQCEACNILAERQRSLIEALKVRGCYNAEFPELQRLFSEGENNALIPIADWSALAEKQGLRGAIDIVDITPISATLVQTFDAMEQMRSQIYDLSGVSDVLRGGGTDPQETATAQTLKSVNGQNRLRTMQLCVAQFASELLKLKAQMICNQYSDQTILNNSCANQLSPQDQALIPQAMTILRNEPARGFKIEVSADSLVLMDEQQEKADRMEFISAIGGYFQQAIPMVTNVPELAPLAIELLKFAAAAFKSGKVVEGLLDETADSFRQQIEQNKGQPKPPPPEMQIEQMRIQADQQKFQAEQQAKQAEQQLKMQAEQAKMEMDLQAKRQQAELTAEVERAKQAFQAEQEKERIVLEDQRAQNEMAMKERLEEKKMLMERNTKLMEIHIKNAGAIGVEQVQAGISDGTEDETRSLAMAEALSKNPLQPTMDAIAGGTNQLAALLQALQAHQSAPKRLIRDEMGRAIGAEMEVPPDVLIAPNDAIAMIQRLPAHNPNATLGNHANEQMGQLATALMGMIENSKRPRQIMRDEAGNITGVH